MPFLLPSRLHQSTEGNSIYNLTRVIFSSKVTIKNNRKLYPAKRITLCCSDERKCSKLPLVRTEYDRYFRSRVTYGKMAITHTWVLLSYLQVTCHSCNVFTYSTKQNSKPWPRQGQPPTGFIVFNTPSDTPGKKDASYQFFNIGTLYIWSPNHTLTKRK